MTAALQCAISEWQAGSFDWRGWEGEAELARAGFAALIGANPASVAIMTTLAEAASTVASTLPARVAAGEIAVPAMEFRSNFLPWEAAERAGFRIVAVELDDTRSWTDTLLAAIGPQTRLVALSEVQSASGIRADVPVILARCREVGAELFLNATQSLGVLRVQPWLREVDYLAAHGYKWMLAPRGATWLYVHPNRVEAMQPLSPSWKSVAMPYQDYYGPSPGFASAASKLDGSLAWFPWAGARAAIDLLAFLPAREAETHALSCAARLRGVLSSAGLDVVREDLPSPIVSATVPNAEALRTRLAEAGVIATVRNGGLRLGCHYFTSHDDVARVGEVLKSS